MHAEKGKKGVKAVKNVRNNRFYAISCTQRHHCNSSIYQDCTRCRIGRPADERRIDVLPWMESPAHEGGVTGVGIAGKIGKVIDDSCSYGIEMNVADEFGQIGVFPAEGRLIAVLEELAVMVMSLIEDDRMTGEEAGHDRMEGDRATHDPTQQQPCSLPSHFRVILTA